jgi:hypothetical protein
MRDNSIYVRYTADVPQTEHWAILRNTSIHIPGDERSRTNPGHGYPESTEHGISYRVFMDKAEFEENLKREIELDFRTHCEGHTIGIHVAGTFQGAPSIKVTETK